MKGRFFYDDGRIQDDVTVDDRVTKFLIQDGKRLRWFLRTNDVEPDGFTVFREVTSPKSGLPQT